MTRALQRYKLDEVLLMRCMILRVRLIRDCFVSFALELASRPLTLLPWRHDKGLAWGRLCIPSNYSLMKLNYRRSVIVSQRWFRLFSSWLWSGFALRMVYIGVQEGNEFTMAE